jgi:hypothetical protein
MNAKKTSHNFLRLCNSFSSCSWNSDFPFSTSLAASHRTLIKSAIGNALVTYICSLALTHKFTNTAVAYSSASSPLFHSFPSARLKNRTLSLSHLIATSFRPIWSRMLGARAYADFLGCPVFCYPIFFPASLTACSRARSRR